MTPHGDPSGFSLGPMPTRQPFGAMPEPQTAETLAAQVTHRAANFRAVLERKQIMWRSGVWLRSALEQACDDVDALAADRDAAERRAEQAEEALREILQASRERRGIPDRDLVVGMGQVASKALAVSAGGTGEGPAE